MNKSNLITLQQQFLQYLERGGKSLNTLKNYKTDLDCFNYFLISKQKGLSVQEFGPKKVMEYDEFLHQKYKSSNSRRRRVQALRLFFDYLVQEEMYAENPIRKIPPSPKFLDIPRPTPLSQIEKLLPHLYQEEKSRSPFAGLLALRNQIIVLLIFDGGLKVSDLTSLQEDHIIMEDPPRVLVAPRKRDPYTVPLSPTFAKIFPSYLKALHFFKDQDQLDFPELLFNANPFRILSGGLSPRGLEMIFAEFRQKLGIQVTPKSLRQACIFHWLHQEKEEALIKEWLGLAPSYSLKIYQEHMSHHIYKKTFLNYPPKIEEEVSTRTP